MADTHKHPPDPPAHVAKHDEPKVDPVTGEFLQPKGPTIKVRAIKDLYYDDKRRRAGDVFTLHARAGMFTERVMNKDTGKPEVDRAGEYVLKEVKKVLTAEEQFSEKSMEKVTDDTPETLTGPRAQLRRIHDEELAARSPMNPAPRPGRPSSQNVLDVDA